MQATSPKAIASLVPMARLLESLGFVVNERTRRAPCLLHSGSNPTAFAWRENGLWHCFSCGAGGDKIGLVRAARRCSFREAIKYLAALSGVEYRSSPITRREIAEIRSRRARAEQAAWQISDDIGRLRSYYTDALHRVERLQGRIGCELLRSNTDTARETLWDELERLAPACTFIHAAWSFIWDAKPDVLVRFALASPPDRRRMILEGGSENAFAA
jgi:DNA primase